MLVKLVVTMQETHQKEIGYLKFIEEIAENKKIVLKCSIQKCTSRSTNSLGRSNNLFHNCNDISRCERCFNLHCDKHIENCKEEINFKLLSKYIRISRFRGEDHLFLIPKYEFVVQRHQDGTTSIDNVYVLETDEIRALTNDERIIADGIVPFLYNNRIFYRF